MHNLRKSSVPYAGKRSTKRVRCWKHPFIYSIGILGCVFSLTPLSNVHAQDVGSGNSQERKAIQHISGVVHDQSNRPLEDVSILIQNTGKGTITDSSGSFSLDVAKGAILVVSKVGYVSKSITVGDNTDYNMQLVSSADDKLGEVVVVAFGNKQKKTLIESVSVVDESVIKNRPVNNAISALQGQAPGLNIVSSSGQPGIAPSINIRGIGSLMSGTSVLVIVDGMPGSLTMLDPSDIASISILKDASASSLYGARAANGVILVTTKKGKLGKISVDYSGYVGWQQPTGLLKEADAYNYANAFNEATMYDVINPTNLNFDSSKMIFTLDQLNGWKSGKVASTDWRKALFSGNNGFTQSHYINIAGGISQGDLTLRSTLSFGFLEQNGKVANTNYKRYSVRTNNELKYKRFTANLSVGLVSDNRYEPSSKAVGNLGSIISAINRQRPVDSIKLYDGSWNITSTNDTRNPVRQAEEGGYNNPMTNNVLVNASAAYNIWDNLTLKYTLGVNYTFNSISLFQNALEWYNGTTTGPNMSTMSNYWDRSITQNALLSYNKTIQRHHIDAIVGWEKYIDNYNSSTLSRSNFINNSSGSMPLGDPTTQTNNSSQYKWILNGFFSRINYDFDRKYMAEFNFRRDASSRLTPGHNTDVFPSMALGWRISEENFWTNLKHVFPELKLRASYGMLGNASTLDNYSGGTNNNKYYSYNSIIGAIYSSGLGYNLQSVFDGTIYNAFSLIQNPNNTLRWERTTVTDVAMEGSLFVPNLTYSIGYFNKRTNRMLFPYPISDVNGVQGTVGVGTQAAFAANLGSMHNRGIEVAFGYSKTSKTGFGYSLNANYTYITSKILDLGGLDLRSTYSLQVGSPFSAFYLYESDGLLTKDEYVNQKSQDPILTGQKWGDQRIKDMTGEGQITSADRVMINKSGVPKHLFGLNFDFNYKNVGIAGMLQGAADYYKYLGASVGYGFNSGYSITDWTIQNSYNPLVNPDNYNTRLPRVSVSNTINNTYPSTMFLFNSSYVRLKNLQVYYDLPSSYLQKIHMKNLRIYASGQNLFTWSKLPKALGIDPEISSATAGYPLVKIYTLGVNVSL
ncbi:MULTISPECIES: SusC/RagA family TonB-linked outer membrane protein [Chitinophagaceae]